jgi:hypothetical protein
VRQVGRAADDFRQQRCKASMASCEALREAIVGPSAATWAM